MATCQTTQLTLGIQDQQAASSHYDIVYRLENTSQHTCTLEGYPGVQLLNASGQPLADADSPQTNGWLYLNQQPQLVTLVPAASAYFFVEWSAAYNDCGTPPGAAFIVVIPPGNQAALRFATSSMSDFCRGTVVVSPVEPTAVGQG